MYCTKSYSQNEIKYLLVRSVSNNVRARVCVSAATRQFFSVFLSTVPRTFCYEREKIPATAFIAKVARTL